MNTADHDAGVLRAPVVVQSGWLGSRVKNAVYSEVRGVGRLLVGRSAARLVGTVRVVCLARVGRWTSAKECDGERVGRRPPPSLRVLGLVGCWFFSHPRCPFHRTQKAATGFWESWNLFRPSDAWRYQSGNLGRSPGFAREERTPIRREGVRRASDHPTSLRMFIETIVLPRQEWERWHERLRLTDDPPEGLIASIAWDSDDRQGHGRQRLGERQRPRALLPETRPTVVQAEGEPPTKRHGEPLAFYLRP